MNDKQYIQKEQKRIHELVWRRYPRYYLTGGTALAFHFNHRFSEDLDFFTQKYKAKDAENIIKMVSRETGYTEKLIIDQKDPKRLPLRMYELELKKGLILKIDMVQDPYKNINPVKNGIHSIEDIYYRKIQITLNPLHAQKDEIGREISKGRQQAKDVYDIFYLSQNYEGLSEFYLKHFPLRYFHRLDFWYRSLNRTDMVFDLKERVPGVVDPKEVFRQLDEQIIRKLGRHPSMQRAYKQGLGL